LVNDTLRVTQLPVTVRELTFAPRCVYTMQDAIAVAGSASARHASVSVKSLFIAERRPKGWVDI
jgi:hypothetical protein